MRNSFRINESTLEETTELQETWTLYIETFQNKTLSASLFPENKIENFVGAWIFESPMINHFINILNEAL